jgi:hypothetical protein
MCHAIDFSTNLVEEGEGRGGERGERGGGESFYSTTTLIPYVACDASKTKTTPMNFCQLNIVL